MKRHAIRQLAAMGVTAVALSGCAGTNLGALGDILGGAMGGPGGTGQQNQLLVEVQGVDSRQQVIAVRTEQGQQGNVLWDQNTLVVYQNQQYPVTALERGDVVVMQVQQTQQGAPYASRIDVRQSVQERTGQGSGVSYPGSGTGQLQQMYGRVGQVDYERGAFQLQTQQGTYVVQMPYNPGTATNDYFRRLRTGDSVRLEGTIVGNGRVELYRFM